MLPRQDNAMWCCQDKTMPCGAAKTQSISEKAVEAAVSRLKGRNMIDIKLQLSLDKHPTQDVYCMLVCSTLLDKLNQSPLPSVTWMRFGAQSRWSCWLASSRTGALGLSNRSGMRKPGQPGSPD